MATCNLGVSSTVKISSAAFVSTKLGTLHPSYGLRIQTPLRYENLVMTRLPKKALMGCRCLSSINESATNSNDGLEASESPGSKTQCIPSKYEVEALVSQVCDTTSIAEFELKLGGFRLYVTRDLTENYKSSPSPLPVPVDVVNKMVEAPDLNGSVSSPSLAVSRFISPSGGVQTLLDKATDEGLAILQSPRVGYFRRSRTIKGKRAPPSCKEKQIVKEGQVLCYIEQLGGEIPIESDVAGEVIKILREDGEPVGYGDALVAILPSFPGIKKLQ